jgi:hypothetical protein
MSMRTRIDLQTQTHVHAPMPVHTPTLGRLLRYGGTTGVVAHMPMRLHTLDTRRCPHADARSAATARAEPHKRVFMGMARGGATATARVVTGLTRHLHIFCTSIPKICKKVLRQFGPCGRLSPYKHRTAFCSCLWDRIPRVRLISPNADWSNRC